jgi:hypothetical protein
MTANNIIIVAHAILKAVAGGIQEDISRGQGGCVQEDDLGRIDIGLEGFPVDDFNARGPA